MWGRARRFPREDDGWAREYSSSWGASSCFRFLDGGWGEERAEVLWRRWVEGGRAGVDMVPHLDQGGGGGTC